MSRRLVRMLTGSFETKKGKRKHCFLVKWFRPIFATLFLSKRSVRPLIPPPRKLSPPRFRLQQRSVPDAQRIR